MGDELNVNPSATPVAHICTEEQALGWVMELIQEMLDWRKECDAAKSVVDQRRALWTFLTKQGAVTGALKTLLLCGLISDPAYKEMTQRASNTLIPTSIRVG